MVTIVTSPYATLSGRGGGSGSVPFAYLLSTVLIAAIIITDEDMHRITLETTLHKESIVRPLCSEYQKNFFSPTNKNFSEKESQTLIFFHSQRCVEWPTLKLGTADISSFPNWSILTEAKLKGRLTYCSLRQLQSESYTQNKHFEEVPY